MGIQSDQPQGCSSVSLWLVIGAGRGFTGISASDTQRAAFWAERMENWQNEIREGYRSLSQLVERGFLKADSSELTEVSKSYRVLVTSYYADLIDPEDPECPIRRQAIPDANELKTVTSSQVDPLGDLQHREAPKVTHRYRQRALLHVTTNCSMYCRYCFRKSLLNDPDQELVVGQYKESFEYLRKHTEIEEVILTGGDPLLVSDSSLKSLFASLSEIEHLQRIRIHSRVPVTLPSRITDEFCSVLDECSLPIVFVTHFNHSRECTDVAMERCELLKESCQILLNQAVLLKGVNDDAETLKELSQALFAGGILPYYLHHPDRAKGTESFWVSRERGLEIFRELQSRESGYLVPRYVVDTGSTEFKYGVGERLADSFFLA